MRHALMTAIHYGVARPVAAVCFWLGPWFMGLNDAGVHFMLMTAPR